MRKLIVNTFLSLDGVMQSPGGPEEDASTGFSQGGWSVNFWDEMMGEVANEMMNKPIDLLLGRKTYQIFASHWPNVKDPSADPLNNATKYVVSRTSPPLDWAKSILINKNVKSEISKLKKQHGPEIQVHGSSNLLQSLHEYELIDEIIVWTFPVVVGNGKRLFESDVPGTSFKLLETKISSSGVIIAKYQREGKFQATGTFALPNE